MKPNNSKVIQIDKEHHEGLKSQRHLPKPQRKKRPLSRVTTRKLKQIKSAVYENKPLEPNPAKENIKKTRIDLKSEYKKMYLALHKGNAEDKKLAAKIYEFVVDLPPLRSRQENLVVALMRRVENKQRLKEQEIESQNKQALKNSPSNAKEEQKNPQHQQAKAQAQVPSEKAVAPSVPAQNAPPIKSQPADKPSPQTHHSSVSPNQTKSNKPGEQKVSTAQPPSTVVPSTPKKSASAQHGVQNRLRAREPAEQKRSDVTQQKSAPTQPKINRPENKAVPKRIQVQASDGKPTPPVPAKSLDSSNVKPSQSSIPTNVNQLRSRVESTPTARAELTQNTSADPIHKPAVKIPAWKLRIQQNKAERLEKQAERKAARSDNAIKVGTDSETTRPNRLKQTRTKKGPKIGH